MLAILYYQIVLQKPRKRVLNDGLLQQAETTAQCGHRGPYQRQKDVKVDASRA